MIERLRPTYLINAGGWTNAASAVADVASIREVLEARDGDLSFIEQAVDKSEETFSCLFCAPLGTPDTSTGIASWSIRMYARYVGGQPTSFSVGLYEGGTTIAEFTPTLAANYNSQHTMLFDPALIQDVRNVRLVIASEPDGENHARVTMADLGIHVLEGSLTNARHRGACI